MNNYLWLFIGFMFGIITSIIFKIICTNKNKNRRRNRGNMIVPRRTVIITHENLISSDSDSDKYSISVEEEETKEETKEEPCIRIAEIV